MTAALKQDSTQFSTGARTARFLPALREVKYTYSDYLAFPERESEKYELIDGRVYMMASPAWRHQWVVSETMRQIGNYLDGKKCKVFSDLDTRPAPKPDKSDDTVVRPDIVVVCDTENQLSKGGEGGVNGVPTMIIEVLSPSNSNHDKVRKFRKYQEAGVREYWIVDPESLTVEVNVLENGKYNLERYCVNRPKEAEEDGGFEGPTQVKISVLEGCVIDLEKVFSYALEEEA